MSPTRTTADDRLRRLLALIPWVAANDGPAVEDVCARFGCTEKELAADIGLLFLCGVHPYTPDALIEAVIEDGRVWIRYADWFRRPLRLTPSEGLALVAAGQALVDQPGTDADGPLARGLAKLAAVLGLEPGEAVEVELGTVPVDLLRSLQTAAAEHRQVDIDYYSFGRDEHTRRVVDPWRVFSAAGQWYLAGWCHRVVGERLFRVDRIVSATMLESTFEPPADDGPGRTEGRLFSPRPDDPLVTLDLEAEAGWVADQYPNEGVEDLGGGRWRVRLRVSEQSWLDRLLLRLGPGARLVDGSATGAEAAARRILARYGA